MSGRRPSIAVRRRRLRRLIESGRTTVALGATDALSARLIEHHGFDCVYVGSYATAASRFGLPDTGLLSLNDMVEQARTIVDAVGLPVIADAEGGFNDAANLWRMVQAFESAGVAAIHIEDHAFGKHTDLPGRLRPVDDMVGRIRAAVEARQDENFLIAARSDALWIAGDLEETIRRLEAYAAAGADLIFPTMVGPNELLAIRERIAKPAMIVDMTRHTLADEERAGAALVLYYGFSALVQFAALDHALATFKQSRDAGTVAGYRDRVEAFEDFMDYRGFARRATRYGNS